MTARANRRWIVLPVLAAVALAAAAAVRFWRDEAAWRWEADRKLAPFEPIIRREADATGLPPSLVASVIRAESDGDPGAVSPRNARGLMQITPIALMEVRRRYDVPAGDLHDPAYNIAVGTRYLRLMANRFDGDAWLAVAAYNMGPTALAKLRRRHDGLGSRELVLRHAPRETRKYARKVLRRGPERIPSG